MALIRLNQFFPALNRPATFYVVLPDEGDLGTVPVVVLLHGVQDDGTGWLRYTSAERYARFKNVALVIPDAGNSFYANMDAGPQIFTFISEALPAQCQRIFGLSPRKEHNYIFGLSMGGYGALKCALTYPERYAGCAAFSAALRPEELMGENAPLSPGEYRAIFGPGIAGGTIPQSCDLYALAAQAKAIPQLLLSCGEADEFYPVNCDFHAFLTQKGIQHTFRPRPGAHDWALWDEELDHALDVFFPN